MKLPLSWVYEYVDIKKVNVNDLADKLLNAGFEVEEIIYLGDKITKVVSCKITKIEKHKDADKLSVCTVSDGKKEFIIVTGAKNIYQGAIVPVALDGATLPGNIVIKSAPLRGVMSYGMMCSYQELGIDASWCDDKSKDGILILEENTPLNKDIKEVLGIDEYILDVSITSNRADCQSIYGLCREISVLYNKKLKPLKLEYKEISTTKTKDIKIMSHDNCSRYTGRIIENIKIEQSPKIIQQRLRLCGLKPINNIVDITNYVLLEVGQPLHAFDMDQLDGDIVVRNSTEKEQVTLLDKSIVTLNEDMMVIADSKKALAIAGVMGGEFSGINDNTKTVYLEAARFARGSIRTTSRKLGVRTDSSARYEKGVDYQSIDTGRERALALFDEIGAGQVTSYKKDVTNKQPTQKQIVTSFEQICSVLGIDVPKKIIEEILNSLYITTKQDKNKLICTVPLFREDIDNFTDLAEEVIRIYGYDKIKSKLFSSSETVFGGYNERQKAINLIKNVMIGDSVNEVITYSFINKNIIDKLNCNDNIIINKQIEIINPLNEEYNVMRTQLASSIFKVINTNITRKNLKFRIFEIAKKYLPAQLPLKELPEERETLAIAYVGEDESFYDLKYVVTTILELFKIDYKIDYTSCPYLHPGIGADIIVNDKVIGNFGKVHPKVSENFAIGNNVFYAEIDLENIINHDIKQIIAKPLPKFPSVERDLAIVIDDNINVGSLVDVIKKTAGDIFEKVELFDIYKGAQIEKNCKSVALSIVLRSQDKTLTESEITDVMNKITEKLSSVYNAKLRS